MSHTDMARIPAARPVRAGVARIPDGSPAGAGLAAHEPAGTPLPRRTDTFAVASAVFGFTAIVPVVSQLIGLVLGVVSLGRIRRARRHGVELAGTTWAVAGIISSGFVLICWLGIFVGMALLSASFLGSADSLGALVAPR